MSANRHASPTPPTPPGTCPWCHTPGQLDLRKRLRINQSVSLDWQCRVCGHSVAQPVAKKTVPDWEQLPEWDVALSKAYGAAAEARKLRAALDKKAAQQAEYHAYLQTEPWRAKSRMVLQRDPICTACGKEPSEQAHHLTYGRIYREPLFDLVGVCRPCHARLHRHDELDEAIESVEPSDEDLKFG